MSQEDNSVMLADAIKKLWRSRTRPKIFVRRVNDKFLNVLNSLLEPSDTQDEMASVSSIFDAFSAKLRILQEIDK